MGDALLERGRRRARVLDVRHRQRAPLACSTCSVLSVLVSSTHPTRPGAGDRSSSYGATSLATLGRTPLRSVRCVDPSVARARRGSPARARELLRAACWRVLDRAFGTEHVSGPCILSPSPSTLSSMLALRAHTHGSAGVCPVVCIRIAMQVCTHFFHRFFDRQNFLPPVFCSHPSFA